MSSKRCKEWQEAILDRLVNELPDEEAILLEQHLSECGDCGRREERLRVMIEGAGPSEAFPVIPAFEADLLRRIRARDLEGRIQTRRKAPRRFDSIWIRISRIVLRPIPAYLAMILLVAACLAGVWMKGRQEGGGFTHPSPGPSAATPALRPNRLEPPREVPMGRMPHKGGFDVTPSDALCLVGSLGSDTL